MKYHYFALSLLASMMTLSLVGGGQLAARAELSPSAPAKNQASTPKMFRYECIKEGQQYTTIAHTPRGPIDLVYWQSQFFGPQWTPERRCDEVTQRFQTYSDAHKLKFVSWGRLNNYKILCISEQSGKCLNNSLLLTLEPQDNPVRVLRSLFNYQTMLVRGRKTVINIEQILQTRPPRTEPASSAITSPNTTVSPQLPE